MTTQWETEAEEQLPEERLPEGQRPELPTYQIKAHVALEGSNEYSWGTTKDTEGSFTWKTGEGEIVGTWSRSPADGLIHVFLETSLQGLVDKATLRFAELAERRKETASTPKTTRTRTPKVEQPPEPNEELIKIDKLRKMFSR